MAQKIFPYVYFNGAIRPHAEAKVGIGCNSLHYGTSCFAGIRGYVRNGDAKIFRLHDHYQRLMNGVKILGVDYHISYQEFYDIIAALVRENKPSCDFYIRPLVFAADEQLAPKANGLHFDLAVYFIQLNKYLDVDSGLRLMISSWRKFSDAAMSTKGKISGCYVNSFLATGEAKRAGYDEALMLDHEGYLVEASIANVILQYRDQLLHPEVGSAALEGITLRSVIELLKRDDKLITPCRIDRSMVYCCSEVILLGTAVQAVYSHSVDGRTIGTGKPGPLFHWIEQKFADLIEGRDPWSELWFEHFAL